MVPWSGAGTTAYEHHTGEPGGPRNRIPRLSPAARGPLQASAIASSETVYDTLVSANRPPSDGNVYASSNPGIPHLHPWEHVGLQSVPVMTESLMAQWFTQDTRQSFAQWAAYAFSHP